MVNPQDAHEILTEHYKQITLEEFNEWHEQYDGEQVSSLVPISPGSATGPIILWQPEAAPLKLNAYLASALTTLSPEQRKYVVAVSDVATSVCEDLDIELYRPMNATDPVDHPHASPEYVFNLDRQRVLDSDLVIHVADYASTGSGEELDFALAALIPIVLLAEGDSKVSRMVTGIPALKLIIKYENLGELRDELRERLTEIRPILEERKLVFAEFERNIVGNKVRILREDFGLTREDVASHLDELLPVDRIQLIEDSNDRLSNPSLMELRYLATVLKTTVADLVEPDLHERMLALLQELMLGRVEARYGMSSGDQRKVLKRILLSVLLNLEKD